MNSDWFIALFAPAVIDRSNSFGTCSRPSIENLFKNAWQLFADTVVAHKYLQEALDMEMTSECVIKTLSTSLKIP